MAQSRYFIFLLCDALCSHSIGVDRLCHCGETMLTKVHFEWFFLLNYIRELLIYCCFFFKHGMGTYQMGLRFSIE